MAAHFSRIFIVIIISGVAHRTSAQAFFASGAPTIPFLMHHHHRLSSSAAAASTITDDSSGTSDESASSVPFRILCLHGKGGNGKEFLKKLQPLRTMVDDRLADANKSCGGASIFKYIFKWDALTAPYQISDTNAYAWWTMPPGVRSFNADEYIGFDESASMVLNAVFPHSTGCNYDLILGHSQGAILLSSLLATNFNMQRSECSYILNGVAWPNPFNNALTLLSEQEVPEMNDTQMLFVMGRNDNINPIESAKEVHDAYQRAGLGVSIVYHNGGHSVPLGNGGDLDSKRALEDICDFILRIAAGKAEKVNTIISPNEKEGNKCEE